MKLTTNAEILLKDRYYQSGENWTKLARRVAKSLSLAEATPELQKIWYDKFAGIIESGEFVPATPFLMNAGISDHYFSCYVLPIPDSLEGIYKTLADASRIFQVAGGCGYSFSNIRPKGTGTTKNPNGRASGPLSFMRVFDSSCAIITTGGSRRGAQMAILRIDHPDIEEFINSKQDLSQLTQFNISCAITDEFMAAVKNDSNFTLVFESHPQKNRIVKARDLWKQIVHNAWVTGDPGLVFMDRINKLDSMGGIEATNPCSEQPLPPYGCCDLGSIDISKCINKRGEFDYARYAELIAISVRFLDNAIDQNNYTLPEIRETQLGERRIGLGIMGLADALIAQNLAYDSDEGRHWAEKIIKIMEDVSKETSEEIAAEKGAFPWQSKSKLKNDLPIRNSMRTTIAPTGSISIIAGCSSGIEPLFALSFTRKHRIAGHEELTETNAAFQRVAIERGFYSDELMRKVSQNNGSCQGLSEVPADVQRIFKVSADIHPADHVKMLSSVQKHIQSAVSKTINLPETATESDIEAVYWQAYESGCKGITVFRDKCRGGVQVLNTGVNEEIVKGRPDKVSGETLRVNTALGRMYITVNKDEKGEPFEVFVTISKGGTNAMADGEAIARLSSLLLRRGGTVVDIVEQLKGIGAGEVAFNKGRAISSIPDAVAHALETLCVAKEERVPLPNDKQKYSAPHGPVLDVCMDCG